MFGSLAMWCSAWYRFMGSSILKKYSISRVFIKHQRLENSLFTRLNSPANDW